MTIPVSAYEPPSQSFDSAGLTPEELVEDIVQPKGSKRLGAHKLDTDKTVLKHQRMVLGWWNYERVRQFDNRAERMLAHDFIDGDQWSDEDKAALEERGQYPGVYNLMKATRDFLVGTERRMRYDYSVLPRHKKDGPAAEDKTKLLKYINNVNAARYARSQAFSDKIVSGLGWKDIGIRSDVTEEPVYCRYEDWRNVWHDSAGKQMDGSDWRYVFRSRIVDYDVAAAMFPDRVDAIRAQLNQQGDILVDEYDEASLDPELAELSGEYDPLSGLGVYRHRVRLIACEYRIPQAVQVVRGEDLGSLHNAIFDDNNAALARLIESGYASLVDSVRMVIYRMVFCGNYVLQWGRRPYNHNRFSLVPDWCFRRKKDGMPYGVAKQQMDPQIDLNKRRAKALWHLSSNQVIIQDQNWIDFDDLAEEKDRPDGMLIVKDINGIQLRDYAKSPVTAEHLRMMEQDAKFIESTGSVNDESRGVQTNAHSGRAIKARQEQTNISTTELFDNSMWSFQQEGEIQLSLAEQFYTDERTIRVTGNDGRPEYIDINKRGEDGSLLNDITATQCDFVIDAQNYAATVRGAMFEQFGNMLSNLPPEVAMQLLDMWVELSDLPGREAMVQRIRSMNGQNDPAEDPNDPEVIARKEAEMEAAKKQQEMQEAMIQLEMALKEAQATKDFALADKAMADAKAALASIQAKAEDVRVKKALALNAIETRRQQAMMPATPTKR